jgi:hypothetical protein
MNQPKVRLKPTKLGDRIALTRDSLRHLSPNGKPNSIYRMFARLVLKRTPLRVVGIDSRGFPIVDCPYKDELGCITVINVQLERHCFRRLP